MAPRSGHKRKGDYKLAGEAEKWSDRVVGEIVRDDGIEDAVSQGETEISQTIQDFEGEAGVDYGIHKIDKKMGKALLKTEWRCA